jgi:hypothetical protein
MPPEIAERLREHGIQAVETATYYLLTRGDCIAVAQRTATGIATPGSTGLLTPTGLAYLVAGDQGDMLAAKGSLVPATPEQSAAIRASSADLKSILG